MKKQTTYKKKRNITALISFLLCVFPIAFFVVRALVSGTLVEHKVTLCATVFVVLVLTALAYVRKVAMRSRIWILLLGLYIALGELLVPLAVIGGTQLIDEVIVSPLHERYKRMAEMQEVLGDGKKT